MSPRVNEDDRFWVTAGAWFMVAALGVILFANSMTKPLGHDEHMYCTGGVLLAGGKLIYRDFSYVAQMPYHPLICAVLYELSGTTHYLLVGRLLSVLCDVVVLFCLVGISRNVFRGSRQMGIAIGLLGCGLLVFNPLFVYASGYAWNHDAVLACVLLSLWLFLSAEPEGKRRRWRYAGAGALLMLAAGMRVTTVLVQFVFLVAVLLGPVKGSRERLRNTFAFVAGTAVVALWPVYTIVAAPKAFVLNLVRIPMLNSKWLYNVDPTHQRFDPGFDALLTGGCIALAVSVVVVYAILLSQRRRIRVTGLGGPILVNCLVAAFVVIAVAVPTMWIQYLAMPVPFLIVSLLFPLAYLEKLARKEGPGKPFAWALIAVVVCAIASVVSNLNLMRNVPVAFAISRWVPTRVHKTAEDIASRTQTPKLAATLAPLYALEGGCEAYTELSAGPFVYRVADFLSDSERKTVRAVGPESIGSFLDARPPEVVIVGVEPKFLEQPLLEPTVEANPQEWVRRDYEGGIVVYLRQ